MIDNDKLNASKVLKFIILNKTNINKVNALELTIELDSGRLISIVQEASSEFALIEGQRVKITKSSNRSRVSPF